MRTVTRFTSEAETTCAENFLEKDCRTSSSMTRIARSGSRSVLCRLDGKDGGDATAREDTGGLPRMHMPQEFSYELCGGSAPKNTCPDVVDTNCPMKRSPS